MRIKKNRSTGQISLMSNTLSYFCILITLLPKPETNIARYHVAITIVRDSVCTFIPPEREECASHERSPYGSRRGDALIGMKLLFRPATPLKHELSVVKRAAAGRSRARRTKSPSSYCEDLCQWSDQAHSRTSSSKIPNCSININKIRFSQWTHKKEKNANFKAVISRRERNCLD